MTVAHEIRPSLSVFAQAVEIVGIRSAKGAPRAIVRRPRRLAPLAVPLSSLAPDTAETLAAIARAQEVQTRIEAAWRDMLRAPAAARDGRAAAIQEMIDLFHETLSAIPRMQPEQEA